MHYCCTYINDKPFLRFTTQIILLKQIFFKILSKISVFSTIFFLTWNGPYQNLSLITKIMGLIINYFYVFGYVGIVMSDFKSYKRLKLRSMSLIRGCPRYNIIFSI